MTGELVTNKLSERFRYRNGIEKNGYFIDAALTDDERMVCLALASGGPLGCGANDIEEKRIELGSIEALVAEGVVRKRNRLQMAKDLIEDETGMGIVDNDTLKKAHEIVGRGEVAENMEVYYQVIPTLFWYMDLVYDG